MAPRPDVPADRAGRGGHLQRDLPGEQRQRAGDVEAVGEEGAVAGVGALLGIDPADREDHLVGLAREQVAAAGAAVDQQPVESFSSLLTSGQNREGIGMGLSLTREILREFGASLDSTAVTGRGVALVLHLPKGKSAFRHLDKIGPSECYEAKNPYR